MRLTSTQGFGRTGCWFCLFFVFSGLSSALYSQTQASAQTQAKMQVQTQTPAQPQAPAQTQVPTAQSQALPSATVQATDQKDEPKTLNDIEIDTKQKEIRMKCKLAITDGILEFFLVDEKGRTYESVFKLTNGKPSDLQFALLLLGYEPIPYKEYAELIKNPKALDVLKKKKCLVDIIVKQKDKQIPLATLLRNREAPDKTDLYWVFTGAPFDAANKFTADYIDVYISIWQEPMAVINLLSNAGNPYRGNFGFEIAANHGFNADDDFTLIIKGAR